MAWAVGVASLAQINQRGHGLNMSLPTLSRNGWEANLLCAANGLSASSLASLYPRR
jgi:hypothetical protein